MIEPGFPRWDDAMSTALVLTERHNKDMIDNVCREIAINRSFSENIFFFDENAKYQMVHFISQIIANPKDTRYIILIKT